MKKTAASSGTKKPAASKKAPAKTASKPKSTITPNLLKGQLMLAADFFEPHERPAKAQ